MGISTSASVTDDAASQDLRQTVASSSVVGEASSPSRGPSRRSASRRPGPPHTLCYHTRARSSSKRRPCAHGCERKKHRKIKLKHRPQRPLWTRCSAARCPHLRRLRRVRRLQPRHRPLRLRRVRRRRPRHRPPRSPWTRCSAARCPHLSCTRRVRWLRPRHQPQRPPWTRCSAARCPHLSFPRRVRRLQPRHQPPRPPWTR